VDFRNLGSDPCVAVKIRILIVKCSEVFGLERCCYNRSMDPTYFAFIRSYCLLATYLISVSLDLVSVIKRE
jgi:hypothetical protein